MTPERVARLVGRWVRLYTRNLPPSIAERRIGEIDADIYDHVAHERAHGSGDRRIALGIASRMVRGLAADASWRGRHVPRRPAIRLTVAAATILLLPLLAMQFTNEVAWGVADFAVAGILLVGTALLLGAAKTAGGTAYRIAAGLALGAVLLLVWAGLAVGIVGETGDPADLMYGGVLGVGIAGAAIARFRAQGMAWTLLAMAVAQLVVAAGALPEIAGPNAIFIALFVASAGLFRHAARSRPPLPE